MKRFFDAKCVILLLWLLSLVAVASAVREPIAAAVLPAGAVVCRVQSYGRKSVAGAGSFFALIALAAVVNALLVHRGQTVLLFVSGRPITAQALLCGGMLGLSLVTVLLWSGVFSRKLSADGVLAAFSALPRTALTLVCGVRYVPLCFRRAAKAREAQKALGAYRSDSFFSRLRVSLRVATGVAARMLESSIAAADSLAARGYTGKMRCYKTPWRAIDTLVLVFLAAACGLLAAGAACGGFAFSFYPAPELGYNLAKALVTGGCALLAFTPPIVEACAAARLSLALRKNAKRATGDFLRNDLVFGGGKL